MSVDRPSGSLTQVQKLKETKGCGNKLKQYPLIQWSNEQSECTQSGKYSILLYANFHRLTNSAHSTVLFITSTNTYKMRHGQLTGNIELFIHRVSVKAR